jgi:hypothetical protein
VTARPITTFFKSALQFFILITIRGHEVQLRRRRVLNHVRRVIASDNVIIPSRATAFVHVKLAFTNLHTRPWNWLIEPRLVSDSLLMARGLFGDAEDSVVRQGRRNHKGRSCRGITSF